MRFKKKLTVTFLLFISLTLSIGSWLGAVQAMECSTAAFEALGLRDLKFHLPVTNLTATKVAAAAATPTTPALPEYCDVRGTMWPAINFEVALPTTEWNNRFYMAGGGGFNGSLPNLNQGLTLNFATAGTDSGHAGFPLDASFAYNPPDNSNPNAAQKKEDFSFRSYHETAHLAKKIIKAFYGHHPRYSYWVGCSEGGREALMMAQRFQDLFDGIIAGAPVLYLTKAHMWSIWNPRALLDGPVTADQLPFLADAIYWKCDGIDGLVDGLIDDPRNCAFDPRKDLPICSTASATCFTTAQTEALHKIYDGVRNSAGRLLFPGQPPGAEVFAGGVSGWVPWIIGSPSLQELIGTSSMQYFSLTPPPGPTWKITDYNFDTDPARMLQTSKMVDMINPNLWEFKHRGGKMIHYAGWADTALTPFMTVNYYESVLDFMGKENTKEFYKLYLIPGMAHCGGGVGCFDSRTNGDVIKLLDAVVEWVEHGIEPYTFVGSRVDNNGTVLRTRPLCPYPAVERYLGKGDINDAKSFVCVVPKHGHDHHDRDHEEWDRE